MRYDKIIQTLIETNAAQATKFISPKEIIRATRKAYNGRFNQRQIEIILTIGKPNYREREFIKDCKKAREIFPIRKIQLKYLKPNKT